MYHWDAFKPFQKLCFRHIFDFHEECSGRNLKGWHCWVITYHERSCLNYQKRRNKFKLPVNLLKAHCTVSVLYFTCLTLLQVINQILMLANRRFRPLQFSSDALHDHMYLTVIPNKTESWILKRPDKPALFKSASASVNPKLVFLSYLWRVSKCYSEIVIFALQGLCIFTAHARWGRYCFHECVSVHTQSVHIHTLLYPIILPLVPCPFWRGTPSLCHNTSTSPMSFVGGTPVTGPGPFQGHTPGQRWGNPWPGQDGGTPGWGTPGMAYPLTRDGVPPTKITCGAVLSGTSGLIFMKEINCFGYISGIFFSILSKVWRIISSFQGLYLLSKIKHIHCSRYWGVFV